MGPVDRRFIGFGGTRVLAIPQGEWALGRESSATREVLFLFVVEYICTLGVPHLGEKRKGWAGS